MWTSINEKWNVNDPLPQTNHFVPVFRKKESDSQFNKNLPFDIFESEKYNERDNSDIIEFDSNINEDNKFDGNTSSSSLSSYITDDEKEIKLIKKDYTQNNRKRTKLDVIKVIIYYNYLLWQNINN